MAADDPKAAASELAGLIATPPPFVRTSEAVYGTEALLKAVPQLVQKLVQVHPLVHNMINFVVANFVANVTLAMYVIHLLTSANNAAAHHPSCLRMATKLQTCVSSTEPC